MRDCRVLGLASKILNMCRGVIRNHTLMVKGRVRVHLIDSHWQRFSRTPSGEVTSRSVNYCAWL